MEESKRKVISKKNPVWDFFTELSYDPQYSWPRVACKKCGQEYSATVPLMKKHKLKCKSTVDHLEKSSVIKIYSDIDGVTNVVNQEFNQTTLVNLFPNTSNLRIGLGRRKRKMPSRFADSIVEEPSLQGLPIAIESIKREKGEGEKPSKKLKYSGLNPANNKERDDDILLTPIKDTVVKKELIIDENSVEPVVVKDIADVPQSFETGAKTLVISHNDLVTSTNLVRINDHSNLSALTTVKKISGKHLEDNRICNDTVENPSRKITISIRTSEQKRENFQDCKLSLPESLIKDYSKSQTEHKNKQIIVRVKKEAQQNNEKILNDIKVGIEPLLIKEPGSDVTSETPGFECFRCNTIYYDKEELKRHLYVCRKLNRFISKARKRKYGPEKSTYICPTCKCIFRDNFNLKRHIARRRCLNEQALDKNKIHQCTKCGINYRNNSCLKAHLKSCGSTGVRSKCLHPSCDLKFRQVRTMLQHVRQAHQDVHFDEKEINFQSLEEFLKWKDVQEAKTLTKYVKICGKAKGKSNKSYINYVCIHSGEKSSKYQPRITSRVHRKGTIRTGLFCPARMTVKLLSDGKVNLHYISTHTHEINLQLTQHHRLAKSTVRYIKEQLSSGIPEKTIQEQLRTGFLDSETKDENGETILRRHIISTWQIAEIGRKMNMQPLNALIHHEDASAVELLVKRLENEGFNPIITYKPQGQPVVVGAIELDDLPYAPNLFAVGVQTQQQMEIMKGGDTRVLCVDTTYCKKNCDIYIFTFVLPDGYGKGYPVAHFLTNHQDETLLHYLFSSLKERCPRLKVDCVMTDGSKSGIIVHKGLSSVFGETRHLLCHGYLIRLWKWRLKMSVKGDRTLQIEIISYLTAILREQNVEFFQELCHSFIEKYKVLCPQFVENFAKTYLNKTEQWAKCYRSTLNGCTDSVPYCKDFQERLKNDFKNRKSNRRIHDLIILLLSFWNDTHVESIMEYPTVSASTTTENSATVTQQVVQTNSEQAEQVWESEPFLQTLFHSEEVRDAADEFEIKLEKLKNFLQEPNIRQLPNFIQRINGVLDNVIQQCEAVVERDPRTNSESDTAVKNMMNTY
ncbi:unnamed protein product, partial [Meganyctiphanes norvegica]